MVSVPNELAPTTLFLTTQLHKYPMKPSVLHHCDARVVLVHGIIDVSEREEQQWHDHGIHSQRNLEGAMEKNEGSREEQEREEESWTKWNHYLQIPLIL